MLLFWPFQETIPKKTAVACEDTKTNKLNEGFCDKMKEGGKSLREINFLFLFHFFENIEFEKGWKSGIESEKVEKSKSFQKAIW